MEHLCHICAKPFANFEALRSHVIEEGARLKQGFQLLTSQPYPNLASALEILYRYITHSSYVSCEQAEVETSPARPAPQPDGNTFPCPDSPCGFVGSGFRDLERHYTQHIPCNEICPFCSRRLERVSQFLRHPRDCTTRKRRGEERSESLLRRQASSTQESNKALQAALGRNCVPATISIDRPSINEIAHGGGHPRSSSHNALPAPTILDTTNVTVCLVCQDSTADRPIDSAPGGDLRPDPFNTLNGETHDGDQQPPVNLARHALALTESATVIDDESLIFDGFDGGFIGRFSECQNGSCSNEVTLARTLEHPGNAGADMQQALFLGNSVMDGTMHFAPNDHFPFMIPDDRLELGTEVSSSGCMFMGMGDEETNHLDSGQPRSRESIVHGSKMYSGSHVDGMFPTSGIS